MSGTRIQAHERSIGDLFTDKYRFSIPLYQRPYAWETEQAGEMLDDLLTAARCEHRLEDAEPYFLGSVVLVKSEDDPQAEIVDGQQRVTTLTVLLSVLRDFVPATFADALGKRLFQEGDPLKGTQDQPRLTLRPQDQPFLEKQILERGGLRQLAEGINTAALTDSQCRLAGNARLFQTRLEEVSEADRMRLASYVDGHTYLVVVSTQDFDSAYRIFTVLNERGLDLSHADILKAEIVGQIPESAQRAYTEIWEHEEEDLGRRPFGDLFSHIRMIFAKTKARESILREFRSTVLSKVPDGRQFINTVLVPSSDAFEAVTRQDFRAAEHQDAINGLLNWLNQLDNTDWIPPTLSYLSRHGGNPQAVLAFLTDLERLAASMHIRRTDITRRIDRYGAVLQEIEDGADLTAPSSSLQLTDDERTRTRTLLDDDLYLVLKVRLYVLLRLDQLLSAGGASYDYPVITVEHVLPQNPPEDSPWRQDFTSPERAQWVHRLANLVLLDRRKNSGAGTKDFTTKKSKYFTGRDGTSPFVLTTQVLHHDEWTPEVLRARQAALLQYLFTLWRL